CSNSSSAVMLAFLMRPGSCWLGSPDCRRNRRARPGRGGPAGRKARSADVRKDAGRLVVLVLFLVLEDLAVELVRQQVDGRVHGLGLGLRMQGTARDGEVRGRAMGGLAQAELHAGGDRLVEMPIEPTQLLLHVIAQGRGDLQLLAVRFDAHREPPLWLPLWAAPHDAGRAPRRCGPARATPECS